jgi:hypothetical protein
MNLKNILEMTCACLLFGGWFTNLNDLKIPSFVAKLTSINFYQLGQLVKAMRM